VINKIDDVGFVRALIDKLAENFPIDRRRIYATGMSNGGMMAHRLAAEASDIIAAVAPVAGGMVLPALISKRAVPVMHMHSVDDPREPSVSSQHRRDDQALGRSRRLRSGTDGHGSSCRSN
jgi:polyhydroxybutyrate depolymerase